MICLVSDICYSHSALFLIVAIDYNEAEALFDEMRKEQPYRIEDMDIYSNLLYLQDSRHKLSLLAHDCVRIDRYRPETCCIVGTSLSCEQTRS